MKRFLCLCLAFCMMLSLFPAGAFAEGDVSLTEFGMEQLSLQEQAFIEQEQTEQLAAEELPTDTVEVPDTVDESRTFHLKKRGGEQKNE